jgi:hypothetical protein
MLSAKPPVSTTPACGPTMQSVFLATPLLVSTIESFVNQSPRGWFADELADVLHVEVRDPLLYLVRAERLRRSEVAGRFLYTSADGPARLAINSAPGNPLRRFLCWPMLPLSRYFPMN